MPLSRSNCYKNLFVMNRKSSDWKKIAAGVPQGSILGPLLFLFYINDLPHGLRSSARIFADDTSLFSTVFDPQSSAENINHDLNLIKNWVYQWKMTFYPDPTKQSAQLVFSKKRVSQNHPLIYFQDTPVTIVDEHKHLGLLMDKKMNFLRT